MVSISSFPSPTSPLHMSLLEDAAIDRQVLMSVFQSLSNICDLKYCRLVCRRWNYLITHFPLTSGRLKFVLDGEPLRMWRINILTLLRSLPFWRHFKFQNLDMERYCLGNAEFFEFFVWRFRNTLTTLQFECCDNLSIGRLVELLAFCKNLRTLRIYNCPQLYTTSVINWMKYLPLVERNMNNVQELCIDEPSEHVNEIWGDIIHLFHNLRRLLIFTDRVDVPGTVILTLSMQNKYLHSLVLACGQLTFEELMLLFRSNLRLRHLELHSMNLPSHVPFSTPAIKDLECLGLRTCNVYDTSNGQTPQKNLFYRSKNISRLEFSICSARSAGDIIGSFFAEQMEKLKMVRLLSVPPDSLQTIFVKTPNVTHLELSVISNRRRGWTLLRPITEYLVHLRRLSLKHVNIRRESQALDFSRLSSLAHVSVTDSNFGDDLLHIFSQMENIRKIRIKQTQISRDGLEGLIKSSQEKLPKLKKLDVAECENCIFSLYEFVTLILSYAPGLHASCTHNIPPPPTPDIDDICT